MGDEIKQADGDQLLDTKATAAYLDFEVYTLAKWRVNNLYDLKPVKRDKKVYYRKNIIDQFLNEHCVTKTDETGPVVGRKKAAKYLRRAPGTLATWDCTKEYDLKPIKIGTRAVRYRISVLTRILEDETRPH